MLAPSCKAANQKAVEMGTMSWQVALELNRHNMEPLMVLDATEDFPAPASANSLHAHVGRTSPPVHTTSTPIPSPPPSPQPDIYPPDCPIQLHNSTPQRLPDDGDYIDYFPNQSCSAPTSDEVAYPEDVEARLAASSVLRDPEVFGTAELLMTTRLTDGDWGHHLKSRMVSV